MKIHHLFLSIFRAKKYVTPYDNMSRNVIICNYKMPFYIICNYKMPFYIICNYKMPFCIICDYKKICHCTKQKICNTIYITQKNMQHNIHWQQRKIEMYTFRYLLDSKCIKYTNFTHIQM